MQDFKFLIIGGGMTADAAVEGIRGVDASGSIGIISKEANPPYKRPPLTKGLWKGEELESIWLGTGKSNVQLIQNRTVVKVDPEKKRVTDDQGTEYTYQKLLLATGGTPRQLKNAPGDVIYFRTLADYEKVRALAGKIKRFAVIGGGFIGSEIAAALRMIGKEVTMIFPEVGPGGLTFPEDLSKHIGEYFREKGIEVLSGELVDTITKDGRKYHIKTKSGKTIIVEAVLAGLGIIPDVTLAQAAGCEVNNGIVVDAFLETTKKDIYAAGDVANFLNPALGKRMRVEHEDNAVTMGEIAGQNMAGKKTAYDHLPFFYSDLFDLGYEAVGEMDPRLEIVADWKEKYEEGVVYYLQAGRVRGVLLWGIFEQVPRARELIAEKGPFTAESLKDRLPREEVEEEIVTK